MTTADRLYAWRAHRGMTLDEVATHAGLTESTVSLAENGRRALRVPTLEAIVTKGLRITMVAFYGDLPTKSPERKTRKAAA